MSSTEMSPSRASLAAESAAEFPLITNANMAGNPDENNLSPVSCHFCMSSIVSWSKKAKCILLFLCRNLCYCPSSSRHRTYRSASKECYHYWNGVQWSKPSGDYKSTTPGSMQTLLTKVQLLPLQQRQQHRLLLQGGWGAGASHAPWTLSDTAKTMETNLFPSHRQCL